MESACEIQINNRINFTSGTACYHSGAPHRSKWNGCTANAEQLSRFTVTCTTYRHRSYYLALTVYDAYKINIESIDPFKDLSMREVYGIDKKQAQ